MRDWLKQNKKNILIMSIYFICSLIILICHESWRDEAQSWLIARDLGIVEIIQQMSYEGHFFLWYIILIPFAKLGFPYFTIKIVSWAIVSTSAWLIIKKSPFKWWVNLLIIFSYPMLYLYPAIARSYCFIPLAITLIAITYKDRKTKPIRYILSIVLLANSHVIMLGLVGMLLLTFYLEQKPNRKIIISFVVVCILLIISMVPILQSLGTNTEVNGNKLTISIEHIKGILMQFYNIIKSMLGTSNLFFVMVTFIYILICAIYELRCKPKNFIIIFTSILYQFWIYEYIYYASEQRANSIFMIILLFAWIQREENKENYIERVIISKMMIIILAINCIFGIKYSIEDIKYAYSSAKQTAQYISENISKENILISRHMPLSEAIIPYLDEYKIWNPQIRDYFTYVTWNEDNKESIGMEFLDIVKETFGEEKELYYIDEKGVDLGHEENLIKIFDSYDSICR